MSRKIAMFGSATPCDAVEHPAVCSAEAVLSKKN
jgi:hypothetical protein